MARYLLDHPATVAGQRVIDVATGSGLVAIAAARAGALSVTAVDVDPDALVAVGLNAAVNDVDITALPGDAFAMDLTGFDVVLAGDVFYEREMAERALRFLHKARRDGCTVLVGDPGRQQFRATEFEWVGEYEVRGVGTVERSDTRRCAVWTLR